MIRGTSIAAILATSATLGASNASAATYLNGRVHQVIHALRHDAQFGARDFSFYMRQGNDKILVFKGISGVRGFNDYAALNAWLDSATSKSDLVGGSYKFTHSVLGSYFNTPAPAPAPAAAGFIPEPEPAPSEPYKFTHSVLDSYFTQPQEPAVTPQSARSEPLFQAMMAPPPAVPEPATWAMMIGGFALAGGVLRSRRVRLRTA